MTETNGIELQGPKPMVTGFNVYLEIEGEIDSEAIQNFIDDLTSIEATTEHIKGASKINISYHGVNKALVNGPIVIKEKPFEFTERCFYRSVDAERKKEKCIFLSDRPNAGREDRKEYQLYGVTGAYAGSAFWTQREKIIREPW